MSAVLWYVHDHGSGHLNRARAVLPHVRSTVVVAAGPGIAAAAAAQLDVPVVELPSDVPPVPSPTVGPWHHAPAGAATQRRGLALAEVIREHRCTTAVVDVSMEVTALARLLGLRVVTVRQSGRRHDAAHVVGLATADVVWVPQHRSLEPVEDGAVDGRWVFTGPFSRFDADRPSPVRATGRRTVVLLVGAGGTTLDADRWRQADAPAGWDVVIAGSPGTWCGRGVRSVGRVEPVLPLLASADVVVTGGGWAAVADAVAARARVAVVPEARPYDEQCVRADALAARHLVTRLPAWPTPNELPAVLEAAMGLDRQRWDAFHDGAGAARAAAMLDRVAAA